jgi:Mce-associated membrane protein
VVLVFVGQTVVVGEEAPTDMSSVVRVSMDKVGDQWLVSRFEPI